MNNTRSTSGSIARKFFSVFLACLSAILVIHGYEIYVGVKYFYFGMPLNEISVIEYIEILIPIALVSYLLPEKLERLPDFMVWVLFYFCFMPSITMAVAIEILAIDKELELLSSITIGMIALMFISRYPISPFATRQKQSIPVWPITILIFCALNFWFILWNYPSMKFVDLSEVNEQRSSSTRFIGLTGYAMAILSGSINPFMMSYALFTRKYYVFVLAAASSIAIYMVLAQKIVLLSAFLIPVFFVMMGWHRGNSNKSKTPLWKVGIIVNSILLGSILLYYLSFEWYSKSIDDLLAMILMRSFSFPGALTSQYALFFQDNPITYFSHVGPGKFFATSPYRLEVSQEIGLFLSGGPRGMNANANFFAYDGIASFGLVGPILAGMLVGFGLLFMSAMGGSKNLSMAALATVPFLFFLCEGSFFTAMVSGGGLLLSFIIYLNRS